MRGTAVVSDTDRVPRRKGVPIQRPARHRITDQQTAAESDLGDRKISVVLVDDHEEIRELFSQVLGVDPAIEVVGVAGSGNQAVEVVRRQTPDIVVMDFVLPDMSGATAIELLRAESPDTKVITVSGLGAPGAYQAAAAAGSSAWVRKTSAVKDLRGAIHQVFAGTRVPDEASVPAVGDIVVHYQPVHRLSTGAVVGMEALARWAHPNGTIIAPGDFLPRAETAGLVGDFDKKVCDIAARQLGEWHVRHRSDPARWVSVNLSALDMRRPDLPDWISNAFAASRIEPSCLVLEVTEAALIDDEDQTIRRLERLKSLGARIALDDFVGAKASIDFMRRFAFDVVKIDRGLIAQLPHSPEAVALMRSIQQVVSQRDLLCVAEGLEREDQVASVQELGCELGQGYLYSQPVPAAECEVLLAAG